MWIVYVFIIIEKVRVTVVFCTFGLRKNLPFCTYILCTIKYANTHAHIVVYFSLGAKKIRAPYPYRLVLYGNYVITLTQLDNNFT